MSISSRHPLKVPRHLLEEGTHVLRPEWVIDYETKRRYDPRDDAPGLPDVLEVKLWDWEEGETLLMAPDGSIGIDYNVNDYPPEFSIVGPHTDDPIFADAEDVGHDLKIQDPDWCQMIAWGPPWRQPGLSVEQEDNTLWVMLTICAPGLEGERAWQYDIALMRGSDNEVDQYSADSDWGTAKQKIQEFLGRLPVRVSAAAPLDTINRHRRQLGMLPLDPRSAGWSAEDIQIEADRIVRLPNLGKLMP